MASKKLMLKRQDRQETAQTEVWVGQKRLNKDTRLTVFHFDPECGRGRADDEAELVPVELGDGRVPRGARECQSCGRAPSAQQLLKQAAEANGGESSADV